MVASWLVFLGGLVLQQLLAHGKLTDVGVTAGWSSLVMGISWLGLVWPVVTRLDHSHLVSSLRWSWLTWGIGGSLAYALLLVPILGADAVLILWLPGFIGALAGVLYGLLRRSHRQA